MAGRTRALLVVLGVAAVAAIVAWTLRGGSEPTAGTPGSAGTGAPATDPARPGTSAPPLARPGVAQPAGPRTGSAAAAANGVEEIEDGDPDTRTYVMDNGAIVRDHRGSGYAPPINPPAMSPDRRTMSTDITARIYQQLAPMVASCGAQVPAEDRGENPFTYVTLNVQVAGGRLAVTDVYPTIHDIEGASAASFPACVRDKAAALSVPTGTEPDRDDYTVQYPIRLR